LSVTETKGLYFLHPCGSGGFHEHSQIPERALSRRSLRLGVPLGDSPGAWGGQPSFASRSPGSLLEGPFAPSMPQTLLEVPRQMPQSQLGAEVGGERREYWGLEWKLLLHSGALSTVRCPKRLRRHFIDLL